MMNVIKYHGMILFRGFVKMLVGTITAGLIAGAVYGFTMIPNEGGYAAVGDFLVAIIFLIVALCGVYLMGGSKKKGAKK